MDSKHWLMHHSVHSPSMLPVSLGGRIRAVFQVNHHRPVLGPQAYIKAILGHSSQLTWAEVVRMSLP